MEIVINIPDATYVATCKGNMLPPDVKNVVEAIKNGITLPKGHGRIIDEDQIPGDNGWDFSDRLMSTPTIIESEVEDAT